jgi:Flp pilus assembly CpaE family ATPase
MAGELAAFWRARYDAVLVDTPDVEAAAASGFAAVADQILLVTTNELPALHAARRAISYLDGHIRDRNNLRLIVKPLCSSDRLETGRSEHRARTEAFCHPEQRL